MSEAPGANGHDRGTLGTMRNAGVLLQLLSEGPLQVSFTELSERSGLSPSTAHRLLRSLVLAGLVQQDPRTSRYSLGLHVVRLSESYLARQPVLRALGPYLVELRMLTEATVLVGLLIGGSVLYADRVDAEQAGGIFRQTERVHDAFETAAGRVLLAHAGQAVWDEARAGSPIGMAFDPADRQAWAVTPWLAVDRTEPAGAVEIAVPVKDRAGNVVAALSALAAVKTLNEDVHAERAGVLLRAARAAGQAVGDA
ncbi:MAG TPA: helix-turn-helix domain-containing protein [Acidimicrobiia bacterium]|nr:helix-turn-helix domain-containing protein [Acidimicrobiia bacterium]